MTQKKKTALYVWLGIIIALVILFLTQCVFVPRCSHERIRENGETYEVYDGIRYQTLKDDTAWRVDYAAFTEKIGCGMLACPTDPNRTVLVYESVGCASMGMLPLIRTDAVLPELGKDALSGIAIMEKDADRVMITDEKALKKIADELAMMCAQPTIANSLSGKHQQKTAVFYFAEYPQLLLTLDIVMYDSGKVYFTYQNALFQGELPALYEALEALCPRNR